MTSRLDSVIACAPYTLELVARARALQSCAVIVIAVRSGGQPKCYDMALVVSLALRMVPMAIQVSPYPEGFIVELPMLTYRDNVLAWSRGLRVGDLLYWFLLWMLTSHSDVTELFYKVHLYIEGMSWHAQQLVSMAHLMVLATLMERIEVDPQEYKDRACCVVWAWTQDPDGFTQTDILQLRTHQGKMRPTGTTMVVGVS